MASGGVLCLDIADSIMICHHNKTGGEKAAICDCSHCSLHYFGVTESEYLHRLHPSFKQLVRRMKKVSQNKKPVAIITG